MNLLIPYFSVAVIVVLLSLKFEKVSDTDIGPYTDNRKQELFVLLLIIGVLIFFSGFRHIQVTAMDEGAYRRRIDFYRNMPLGYLLRNTSTPLFEIVLWLSNKVYPNNQGGLLFTSIIIVVFFIVTFIRDCKDISFALLLFFVNGYFYGTFNGVAQTFAASIILYGFKYVYKEEFGKYLLTVIIATLAHSSSIVLLPLYFFVNSPPFSKKIIIFDICLAALMVFGYRNLTYFINRLGILTDYIGLESTGHHGVNWITILISVAPSVLVYFISDLIAENDRTTIAAANMVVIDAVILMVSSIDVYIARFSLFTAPFSIIFLSRISLYLEERNNLLKPMIIILYTIVFIARYYAGVQYFLSF